MGLLEKNFGTPPQPKKPTAEEREEVIDGLVTELSKRIIVGGGPQQPLPPLEETEAFKRFEASGIEIRIPPKPLPKTNVDYDKLIDGIVAGIPHDVTAIGNFEPICPYCSTVFKKKPMGKTKCKSCGNFIYVMTRPYDNQKVLIRDEQHKEIEIQKIIKSGSYGQYIDRLKADLKHNQKKGNDSWRADTCPIGSLAPPDAEKFDGKIVRNGSPDEIVVLKVICTPGCFGGPDIKYDFEKELVL